MGRSQCLFWGVLVLVCSLLYRPVWAANEAVLEARKSVVRVIAFDGKGNGSKGTGFAVGRAGEPVRYFVTNSHVIIGNPENDFYPTGIVIIFEDLIRTDSIYSAKVIYSSKVLAPDVAILDIGTPVNFREPAKLLPSGGGVRETDDVYAIGFPGTSDDINDGGRQTLPSQPENATTSKGIITKLKIRSGNTDCYQIDAVVNHGNSGGPLVTEGGNIIGINTFGALEGGETNGAIYIDTLFPLFEKYNIPYRLAAVKENQEISPANQLTEKNRLEEQEGQKPAGFGEGFSQAVRDDGLLLTSLAIIAGVTGLMIIVIADGCKKRNKSFFRLDDLQQQDYEKTLSRPPSIAESIKQPYLAGISGEHAGKKYPLQYGKVTIGRDAGTCHVVFDNNITGVSLRHCEVSYNREARCFIVVDLGSTYGTFGENGQKLIAGMPSVMRENESFYLAVPYNKFVLRIE